MQKVNPLVKETTYGGGEVDARIAMAREVKCIHVLNGVPYVEFMDGATAKTVMATQDETNLWFDKEWKKHPLTIQLSKEVKEQGLAEFQLKECADCYWAEAKMVGTGEACCTRPSLAIIEKGICQAKRKGTPRA